MIKLVNKIKLPRVSRLRVQPIMSPFSTAPLLTVPKRETKKNNASQNRACDISHPVLKLSQVPEKDWDQRNTSNLGAGAKHQAYL